MLPLDTELEIRDLASRILKGAGVEGRVPTPVTAVLNAAGLVVSTNCHPWRAEAAQLFALHGNSTLTGAQLTTALSKAVGLVDLRGNIVYVAPTLSREKTTFVQFHEVGHKLLPWQRDVYLYLDDHTTLDTDTNAAFEREANYFAAEVMFQGELFRQQAMNCEPTMSAVSKLSKHFGASMHATARRFAETHHDACALLVFESSDGQLVPKKVIYSPLFREAVGELPFEALAFAPYPFAEHFAAKHRWLSDQYMAICDHHSTEMLCRYDYFWNSYNALVLLRPDRPMSQLLSKLSL